MPKGIGGRRGDDVRSDCYVAIEPRDSGGLTIALKSKVESMYGESIVRTWEPSHLRSWRVSRSRSSA
jgi:citrate lyase gamma subunit